jgi:membrane protein DedA with SNARE-associated domain
MEHIQPYLDYFSAHPSWAIVVIFLIAFGEALLIIGLFVPSTVVLVGAGTLVGTGHLDFWAVFLATAIGAIAGDQVSYWAGRLFGERLKQFWPLSRYPALVAKGEDFVKSHGGKSIAIGRFVPGVKAVVPGIVGMLGMSQPFFVFVNVTSGIFWAAAHVFPGILIGQGLALAGEFSGRLTFLLVLLLVALGVLGWVIRVLSAGLFTPFIRRILAGLSKLAKARKSRPFYRLGRKLSPDHPKAARIVAMVLSLVIAAAIVTYLFIRVGTLDAASNLDQSVFGILSDLRNAPGDLLMTRISMTGEAPVLLMLCAAMAAWLLIHRAWRTALAVAVAVAAEQSLVALLKLVFARPRPIALPPDAYEMAYSFPSSHAALAMLSFGLLAVVAGHAMGRWSKALIYSLAGMVIFLIGFSRLYLGVHWLGDVLAGVALSAVITTAFGVTLEAWPAPRIRPLGMIGVALTAWLLAAGINIEWNGNVREASYAPPVATRSFDLQTWQNEAWLHTPPRRVDLSGKSGDAFVAQWVGSLENLESQLKGDGFEIMPPWSWSAALAYSDPHAPFNTVPPRPLLHEGLGARFTAVLKDKDNADKRLVLRVFKTGNRIAVDGQNRPVFVLSLLHEDNAPRFKLFTLPRSYPASNDEIRAFLSGLSGTVLPGSPEKPVILAGN